MKRSIYKNPKENRRLHLRAFYTFLVGLMLNSEECASQVLQHSHRAAAPRETTENIYVEELRVARPDYLSGDAIGVNENGDVYGTILISMACCDNSKPAAWLGGGAVTLPYGQASGTLRARNNAGIGVGHVAYFDAGNMLVKALVFKGNETLQPLPKEAVSAFLSINDTGVAVGYSGGAEGTLRAIAWHEKSGSLNLAPLRGSDYSLATAINNSGDIVGTSMVNGLPYIVIWRQKGRAEKLPTNGAQPAYGAAMAINARGDVVGYRYDAYTGSVFPIYIARSKAIIEIDYSQMRTGSESPAGQLSAISSAGVAVGLIFSAEKMVPIFVSRNGVAKELPLPTGSTSGFAQGIGEDGTIVGCAMKLNSAGFEMCRPVVWRTHSKIRQ
jgi:uncharacterized membrane protein